MTHAIDSARQELVRAAVEIINVSTLHDNRFEGALTPIGTPEELYYLGTILREGNATIIQDRLADEEHQVYNMIIEEGGNIQNNIWVNEYWRMYLNDAAVLAEAEENILSPEEEAMLEAALESEHQEIPVNSQTITVDETTSRFSGAIWYEEIQKQTVTLAGCGGIGSYVGFLLGRLKPAKLIMYDPDRVETVNMSGQLYSNTDIGSHKVRSLSSMIGSYALYYNVVAIPARFEAHSEVTDIMICGFDNMAARKTFYERWKQRVMSYYHVEDRKKCLFIDGRLAAEEFQVLSIQGDDERAMKEYEDKWLFSDAEAEETICSYKQTTFMANMIASTMVNVFVNFVANMCNPIIDRDVPFFISYDASTMFTKVEM